MGKIFSKIAHAFDYEYYRLSLWNCVFFIFGIILYFSLDFEPPITRVIIIFVISLLSLFFKRYHPITFLLSSIIVAFTAGILVSKIRTDNVVTAPLLEPVKAKVQGNVYSIKHTPRGSQVTLNKVLFTSLLMQDKDPTIVKVFMKRDIAEQLLIGDYIEVFAELSPSLRSILPGGFDFGFYAYFEGVGAVGYATSKVKIINRSSGGISSFIQELRKYIYKRLIDAMGNNAGNVAAALILGEQGGIDRTLLQDMRFAGISHILGIHLALVAGIFFLSARILLNLSDRIAWNYNIKLISAIIAIATSAFYLALSSERIAATRGFIVTVIIMLGIAVGRAPFSRRSLCIAAIIMLTFNPEYVFHPTFQLSFIAVLALIAGFEFFIKHMRMFGDARSIWGKLRLGFWSNIYSTLIAGTSTAPIVIYHFYVHSNYAILANILILPLLFFVIMPLSTLAIVLMPIHLDYPFLFLAGRLIEIIIAVSSFTANLPGAVWYFGHITDASLIVYMIGLFWLTLWQGSLKLRSIPIILISLIMMLSTSNPDKFIDPHEGIMGVKNEQGKLEIRGQGVSKFYQAYLSNWYGQKEVIYFDVAIPKDITPGTVLIYCDKGLCQRQYTKPNRFIPR